MKQLRITTSKPGFMGIVKEPLIIPNDIEDLTGYNLPFKCAYLHDKAETLAGYDIPIFLDGDMGNLIKPIDEQDILLLLPSGKYKCKATVEQDLVHKAYYITLK